MIGAILGDIIGSRFEFDRGDKTKDFTLFTYESEYTDDTVMTVAVAEVLLKTYGMSLTSLDEKKVKDDLINSMKKWGRKYPFAGYGGRFIGWLMGDSTEPYNSFGNGSAMRVSPAGWLYETLEETRKVARWTAEVTHNHPEGIKGAESVAAVMFLARTGHSKEEIREYVTREFGYDLSRTCDEIRPLYHHVESCQETVPEAMTAFFEGESFEDVIRTAVSLGGDCDTLTDIAGAMAEAFYGVPDELISECFMRLPDDMRKVLDEFDELVHPDHYITLCGGIKPQDFGV
ncbi:MAG: ADP-ribosylglycohydrolase family protein [Clostridia bacterium]|nr:ADP-ribosylglycohydrolase family protein [Clostridia bacterium]